MKAVNCGYFISEPFFEAEDFSVITNFNTPEALNALGIASSDIAEMGLGEISRTVLAPVSYTHLDVYKRQVCGYG